MMKKEYFSIPNLMGYFRILMIPVFLVLYYHAETPGEYGAAFLVLAVSMLTDFFDGKIARKFNMVTDFGKALDPVADKLTQCALAVAVMFQYPLMWIFLTLFVCKETYMGLMGMYLIRKKQMWTAAQWHGKICTGAMDIGIFILLLFPEIPYKTAYIMMAVMMLLMLYSLLRYIQYHLHVLKGKTAGKRHPKRWIAMILCVLAYLVLGASVPYLKKPKISEEYQKSLKTESFYSDTFSCDRAAIIEENGQALSERIRLIEQAKSSLILSTFDFHSDVSGKQMLASLTAAAERGVDVRILVDGWNFLLNMEGNPYFFALNSLENVSFKIYNPMNLFTPWKGMSRMHDKYLIADETAYILGGRNTFDYFLGAQNGYKNHDRDVLVYNTKGAESSVYTLIDYFENVWEMDLCHEWKPLSWIADTPCVKDAREELSEIYNEMQQTHEVWFETPDYMSETVPVNKISLLSNPTHLYSKEPWVFYSLGELMAQAKERVLIHTPYIICDGMMYETLEKVCRSGADVTLMTNSAKNNGNPFGATDYVLHKDEIMATGMQVLEYNGGVSYHGKSLVIDDDLSVIGSFNMDMKSVYHDTELMLVVHSRELNEQLSEKMEAFHEDAQEAEAVSDVWKELTDDVSIKQKIQRFFIRIVDPVMRFLL